mgnify:CR=1 FL=1
MASPLVIPIFIPHSGCPHQCAFCNQKAITRETRNLPDPDRMAAVIRQYLTYKGARTRVELGFFGGNFLGLNPWQINRLLADVQPFLDSGAIQGIRFSTRPDTVTENTLDLLRSWPVSLVELGAQTMNDQVLDRVNRGHTSDDTIQAMALLEKRGLGAGIQVMVGLPGDTRESMVRTADILAGLKPLTARIYPVLVLKKTLLAQWFRNGEYQPLTLDRAVAISAEMRRIFTRAGVAVIRTGLQTSGTRDPDVIAGPAHPAFGHLVLSRIMYETVVQKIQDLTYDQGSGQINLWVHPRYESRLRGNQNSNLHRLKAVFPDVDFAIHADPAMGPDQVDILKCPV